MRTERQTYGAFAESIVQRHCTCVSCGRRNWTVAGLDQEGIDLQCRACGRFGQTKGHFCPGPISLRNLGSLAGGSHAVYLRHAAQGHKIDLYVVLWNRKNEFAVLGLRSDDQPAELIKARTILSGPRAGYALADIDLTAAPFGTLQLRAARLIQPGSNLPVSRQHVWRATSPDALAASNPVWATLRERFSASADGHVEVKRAERRTRRRRGNADGAKAPELGDGALAALPLNPHPFGSDVSEASCDIRNEQRRILESKSRLALEGSRVPTLEELVCGCLPLFGDVQADANRFATDALAEFDDEPSSHDLFLALLPLRVSPTPRDYQRAADRYDERSKQRQSQEDDRAAIRCHFYAALSGDQDATHRVAGFAVAAAYSRKISGAEVHMSMRAAVIWLLAATKKIQLPSGRTNEVRGGWVADAACGELVRRMEERMLASRLHLENLDGAKPQANGGIRAKLGRQKTG